MFGLVLSFVVRLSAADGGRCQNVELPFEGSMQQCALFGQHQAARWVTEHRGWQMRRGYRCLTGKAA